jgi:hypothetical protein
MSDIDQKTLQALLDQRDIERVLTTYARAVDRQDLELLRSCYHPDAINHNAVSRSNAWEFAGMLLPLMRRLFSGTMHHVTHSDIRVEGDRAVVESYFIAWHGVVGGYEEIVTMFGSAYADEMQRLGKLEGGHDFVGAGRYLDRFERRNGAWRIAERNVTMEWNHYGPVTHGSPESLFGKMPAWARRDRTDPVYRLSALTAPL